MSSVMAPAPICFHQFKRLMERRLNSSIKPTDHHKFTVTPDILTTPLMEDGFEISVQCDRDFNQMVATGMVAYTLALFGLMVYHFMEPRTIFAMRDSTKDDAYIMTGTYVPASSHGKAMLSFSPQKTMMEIPTTTFNYMYMKGLRLTKISLL